MKYIELPKELEDTLHYFCPEKDGEAYFYIPYAFTYENGKYKMVHYGALSDDVLDEILNKQDYKDCLVKNNTYISVEFKGYVGYVFEDHNQNELKYEDIKDNYYALDGRVGKIIRTNKTTTYEHGYSGSYYNYIFVFKDDLSTASLIDKTILIKTLL